MKDIYIDRRKKLREMKTYKGGKILREKLFWEEDTEKKFIFFKICTLLKIEKAF